MKVRIFNPKFSYRRITFLPHPPPPLWFSLICGSTKSKWSIFQINPGPEAQRSALNEPRQSCVSKACDVCNAITTTSSHPPLLSLGLANYFPLAFILLCKETVPLRPQANQRPFANPVKSYVIHRFPNGIIHVSQTIKEAFSSCLNED